jgi:hypothetical protein
MTLGGALDSARTRMERAPAYARQERRPRMAGGTKEELTNALIRQAIALFGEVSVEQLRPGLEELAEQLWLLDQASLDRDEEPAVMYFP